MNRVRGCVVGKKLPGKIRKRRERDRLLLARLTRVLSECERAGLKPRVRHGILFTRDGVVLPPEKGNEWLLRLFVKVF